MIKTNEPAVNTYRSDLRRQLLDQTFLYYPRFINILPNLSVYNLEKMEMRIWHMEK